MIHSPVAQRHGKIDQRKDTMQALRQFKTYLLKQPFILNYIRMGPYIIPYRWRLISAMLISIPIGLMNATIAWTLKPFLDQLNTGGNTGNFRRT